MRRSVIWLIVALFVGCRPAGLVSPPIETPCDNRTMPAEVRYQALRALLGDNLLALRDLDHLVDLFQYSLHPESVARDASGATVLDHLYCLASTPRAGGLGNREWLVQALRILADPEGIHQGAFKVTCGPAVAEYLLAKRHLVELANLMNGLTGGGMRATLASGATMRASQESYAPDNSGRPAMDRVLQSAFMDEALLAFDYDNDVDQGQITWRQFWGETGTTTSRLANLMRDLTGDAYGARLASPASAADLLQQWVIPQVLRGEMVIVSVRWSDYGHFLAVTGVETGGDGTVWLRLKNPWGPFDRLGIGPKRERLDDRGAIRMQAGELVHILNGIIVAGPAGG